MSKKTLLKSHLNYFLQYPIILCSQASDLVKDNLVTASIFKDVFVLWKFDGIDIWEDLNNVYRKDIIVIYFYNYLHLLSSLDIQK